MKGKILAFSLLSVFVCSGAFSATLDLESALRETYRACVNIDDNLHELKVLAGINTAVTGVGTGLGIGAVATGLAKAETDAEIERLFDEMWEISGDFDGDFPTAEEKDTWYQNFLKKIEKTEWGGSKVSSESQKSETTSATSEKEQRIQELNEKSKRLGNWRTGLLAGNTATNIAGAIIASKTINKDDIQGQVEACISATKELNNAINAAHMNGEDVSEAKRIYEACREYSYVDITPINKRGKGAMISSSVGAVVGGVGTITSGVANSDGIRNDDTSAGREKEKNLNTASNVLAVGATAASATATVFNATQIAAIKKVASVAQECTGVLK